MKKDSVFFDGEGLTSTSANHIANMAKEWYQMLEREVKDIHLEEQSVGLLSEESSRELRQSR